MNGTMDLNCRSKTIQNRAGSVVLACMSGCDVDVSGEGCAIRLQPAALIDACFAAGAQVATRLGLDDQIHRCAATL